MARHHLRCSECSRRLEPSAQTMLCPECSAGARPAEPLRGVLEVVIEDLPQTWPAGPISSPEALAAFWPIESPASLPPLPVGGTPLLPVPRLRRALDMPGLWLKDDTRNPSGSTKDRASQLVVARAHELGIETIATASTGNAATALAAVCAAAGLRAVVLVPASAPRAKLVQMLTYGATVLPIDGTYDQAFDLCQAACDALGWYSRNTALNPYTIEGKKTAALEIAHDLAPVEPDAVIVPTGDGVIISGVAKGFADLHTAGLISRVPRLIAAQPTGSNAIATAVCSQGERDVGARAGAASVADSLVVEAPRNGRMAVRRIRETGGSAVELKDQEILEAIPRLAACTGVFAEPAAATALAGLEQALASGLVTQSEQVVLLITGTGLKDVAAAERATRMPPPLEPTLDAVRSACCSTSR